MSKLFLRDRSSHWIADKTTSRRVPSAEYVKARQAGISIFCNGENETTIIGGHFKFEDNDIHPFLKDLPQIIHITQFETKHQLFL